METIEEALNNPAINTGLPMSSAIQIAERAFKAGVEFAQQWIPVNDKNVSLEVGMSILVKDDDNDLCVFKNIDKCDMSIIKSYYKEWRPIEYK